MRPSSSLPCHIPILVSSLLPQEKKKLDLTNLSQCTVDMLRNIAHFSIFGRLQPCAHRWDAAFTTDRMHYWEMWMIYSVENQERIRKTHIERERISYYSGAQHVCIINNISMLSSGFFFFGCPVRCCQTRRRENIYGASMIFLWKLILYRRGFAITDLYCNGWYYHSWEDHWTVWRKKSLLPGMVAVS